MSAPTYFVGAFSGGVLFLVWLLALVAACLFLLTGSIYLGFIENPKVAGLGWAVFAGMMSVILGVRFHIGHTRKERIENLIRYSVIVNIHWLNDARTRLLVKDVYGHLDKKRWQTELQDLLEESTASRLNKKEAHLFTKKRKRFLIFAEAFVEDAIAGRVAEANT